VLKLDAPDGQPPLLSVFGGKITTFRKLAEAALEKVAPFFPQMGKPWTAEAAFAGGDFPYADVEARIADFGRRYAFLNPQNARRIFRSYGTRADRVLGGAKNANDLGRSFGSLSEREIDYLRREEWAETPEDILWRRSKLGLHLAEAEQNALRSHMESNAASPQRDKTVRVAQ
jgi:glycerol-3-phosphate dehydrogenase